MIETKRDYIDKELEAYLNTETVCDMYPHMKDFDIKFSLVNVDLDKKCKETVESNRGFVITKKQNLKKDIKSEDGIYSSRWGTTIDDKNAFATRYRCECGQLQGKLYNGIVCPTCHKQVKYVYDDFSYLGWIRVIDKYHIIHPNLYKMLASFIGEKVLDDIISCKDTLDENGKVIEITPTNKNPFSGYGMIGFYENFEEIMNYYLRKKPNKKDYYDFIMKEKDKVFCHSIPVYCHQLRPFSIQGNKFTFEANNARYNTLASEIKNLNNEDIFTRGKRKPVSSLLYSIQSTWMEIVDDIDNMLSGKRGYIRSLIGGRFNFSSRDVIIPDPTLNIDEITLPYVTLVEFLEFDLVSHFSKTETAFKAYEKWNNARSMYDEEVAEVILNIITVKIMWVMLGRNPSIGIESVRFMRVVGINKHYAAGVPLQILKGMGADFDGDCLNVMMLTKEFAMKGMKIFNPRYSCIISKNNGMFNSSVSLESDTFINLNSFVYLGRDIIKERNPEGYKANVAKIRMLQARRPRFKSNIEVPTEDEIRKVQGLDTVYRSPFKKVVDYSSPFLRM